MIIIQEAATSTTHERPLCLRKEGSSVGDEGAYVCTLEVLKYCRLKDSKFFFLLIWI